MITRSFIFGLLACATPFLATAEPALKFPDGSTRGYERVARATQFQLPVGPYSNGKVITMSVAGTVLQEVWKTPLLKVDTFALMATLRQQLEASGYTVLYQCATRACGGFDFRFNADVPEEPDMHVDLGDFRYLAASKLNRGKEEYIGLLVSRSPDRGFIQLTQINAGSDIKPAVSVSTKQASPAIELAEVSNLSGKLQKNGAAVLGGLQFIKGSAKLAGTPSESLQELAAFLAANPDIGVVLVGHTDASGSLDRNIALSRKRAESVLKRLTDTYGVNPGQLRAEGVGFLSPRATNTTEEGRSKNRRVEVVLATIN